MKRALIVGLRGQDSTLLYDRLAASGYDVAAAGATGSRRGSGKTFGTLDVREHAQVRRWTAGFKPDEVYYLAAHHHASEGGAEDGPEAFGKAFEVNVLGLVHFLSELRSSGKGSRLFYASSSRVFGAPAAKLVDESAPLKPIDHYGVTKAAGMLACRAHRERYGVYASTGILFNHESELRAPSFVSRKLAKAAAAAKGGAKRKVVVGDLSARADWGSARDFVEAMQGILALPEPDDFVVATGKLHSVQDLARAAFAEAGLDWRQHVAEDPKLLKGPRIAVAGDASKLERLTGWKPKTSFEELVRGMVRAELA